MKFLTSIFLLPIFLLIVFSLLTTAQFLWTFGAHQHDDYVSHHHTVTMEGDLGDFSDEDILALIESLSGDPHDWDNDHSDVGEQSTSHSHEVTHQHGDYASHTHSGTHSHASPDDVHSDPHDWDNDHSRMIVINPVEKSITLGPHKHDDYVSHTHTVTYSGNTANIPSDPHEGSPDHSNVDRTTGNPQPPQLQRQPQQRSHSHDITHQHDDYVSHTHTVTHTGDASPHTHTYTESETHSLSDGNHVGVGTKQPTNNPPPGNNQGNSPPPGNNPSPTVGEGGTPEGTTTTTVATPVVEGGGGTPQATSGPQSVAPVVTSSAPQEPPQERPPEPPPMQPLRVTEYMVRDRSIGALQLPQWIELHNPNTEAVNLKGYTFQYATRRFANDPYKIHTLTLAATEDEEFSIPSGGVALLTTQRLPENQRFPARKFSFSGIEATQVYALGIENVLKRGWVLTDADGKEIHRLGRDAFDALGDPVAPLHKERARVSYHAYPSESPSEPYYYGSSQDIGSPGFYEEPAPAAPSAVKRKRVGTWASLKQTP